MSDFQDDGAPPLPRAWLPTSSPREGSPEWEALLSRVLSAAAPPAPPWPLLLGSWLRPAAALAAAAATLLLIVRAEAPVTVAAGNGALPLAVLTARGEPAALLEELGIPADPVLALIASGGRDTSSGEQTTP